MTIDDICNNISDALTKIFKEHQISTIYNDNFIVNVKHYYCGFYQPSESKEIIVNFSFDTKIIFKLGADNKERLNELIEIYKSNKSDIENNLCYFSLEKAETIFSLLKEPKQNFKKDDKDKLQYDLLPPRELAKVVEVLTLGANKYGKDNWKLCNNKSRYINAIFRHLEAYRNGEMLDKESNINHFAHIACNALFILYFDNK